MPPPFSVRSGEDPGTDHGSWDDTGSINLPGNLTVGGTITGNIELSGDQTLAGLHVTGNDQIDGNESVGGTFTATGNATLNGFTAMQSAQTAGNFDVYGSQLTAHNGLAVDGNATVGGTFSVAGTALLGAAHPCTSTTRPATPVQGQLIYETDTGMTAVYNGTGWAYLVPDGTVGTSAEYNASVAQSIPNSTDTTVAFGTNNMTTPLVTKSVSGAGHLFTLNRAGVWSITATLRYVAASTARETYAGIYDSSGNKLGAASSVTSINVATTMNVAVTRWFAAGNAVLVDAFQSSGGALNTMPDAGWTRINLSWLHG